MRLNVNVELPSLFAKRAFRREMVEFFKNLSLMAQSGIPLNEALQVLASQARSPSFKKFLTKIKIQLEQGSSLSKAFTPHRELVGDLVLNVIRAGELNGTLEKNFQYLADLLSRRRDLQQKMQSALLYPEIVSTMVFFVGGGIAVFILPKLLPLFSSLKVALPPATRLLLWISHTLQAYGVFILVGAVAAFFTLSALGKIYSVRRIYHTILLRIPFIGHMVRNYQMALFSQLFGTLFRSGLTIKDTLTATGNALTNVRYQEVLQIATKRLVAGVPLATVLKNYPFYFPQNAVSIIAVGENSGKLDESVTYLANYYDQELELQTRRLPIILEPILLLGIGIAVAFVALAIITPIYEITSGISSHR